MKVNLRRRNVAELYPLSACKTRTAAELDALMPPILSRALRGEL